ncbi:hypothetical protein NPA30_05740 [Aurantimonas sp. CSK15Z-1]|nr:hypothetical protein [Aurantimonas sp. CSK15Z-1]
MQPCIDHSDDIPPFIPLAVAAACISQRLRDDLDNAAEIAVAKGWDRPQVRRPERAR